MKELIFLSFIIMNLVSVGQELERTRLETGDQGEWVLELLEMSDSVLHNNPSSALGYAKEAFLISEVLKSETLLAQSLNRIGLAQWALGDYELALKYLNQSIEKSISVGNMELAARNLGNLGSVYAEVGLSDYSIRFYREALRMFESRQNSERILVLNNNLGKVFLDIQELDSAELYLKKSLKMYRMDSVNSVRYAPIVLMKIAELEFKRGNIEASDSVLQRVFKLANELNDKRAQCRANILDAKIALKQGLKDDALISALEANKFAKRTKSKVLMSLSADILSETYAVFGRYELSYGLLKKSIAFEDSLRISRMRGQLLIIESANEMDGKMAEGFKYDLLGINSRNLNVFLWSLILIVLIVAVWLVLLLRKSGRLKREKTKLERLDKINSQVCEIVNSKIQITIQMIHSALSVIEINPSAINEDVVYPLRRKTESLLDAVEAVSVGMNYLNSLKVRKVFIHELLDSIVSENSELFEEKGLSIESAVEDDEFVNSNPEILRIIVRSVLMNAGKFSFEGGLIEVFSESSDDYYKLTIKDEGVGMTEEQLALLFSKDQIITEGPNMEQGLGVSLRIAQGFCKLINAEMEATSSSLRTVISIKIRK